IATTLERDEAEGRAALDSQTLTKSHRLAIEEQVARDEAARRELPTEVAASKSAENDLEARAQQLQKDYQALLDQLLAELANKQKEAAASPEKSSKPAGSASVKASGSVEAGAAKPEVAPEATPPASSDAAPSEPPMGPPPATPDPAPAPPKAP
ncbi:MAG TPA: hypothetical protein VMG12_39580, partial [Polyangiaceae bacterium]|nr:hypothetical protein [Polyangiaceae bacterium]